MLSTLLLAALSASPVAAKTPVHLGLSLQLTHPAELEALAQAQQNPKSPEFRRWLTPAEFGARFGQSEESYQKVAQWLRAGGLEVTLAPSRAFLEARGTAEQVQKLLKLKLLSVEGQPSSVHTLSAPPTLPAAIAPLIVDISGLDTRVRFRHHLFINGGITTFGPQDLRHEYNTQPLLDQGYTGQGLRTAVLSTAETTGNGASVAAITWFFKNISNARANLVEDVIPNPQNDVDNQPGSGIEFDLDTEMHSVSVPGADSIILVVSPASEVFTTGATHIANDLSDVAAVSISLGLCEPAETQQINQTHMDEYLALRNAVKQGTMEGQTWSAASGDDGADDCRNGSGIAVDFPADIPEMIAAGGSELKPPTFDVNHAITSYTQEVTWNDGAQGGAAGGGVSTEFSIPSYQTLAGLTGTGRLMPDIALMAGNPGVAIADQEPPGPLDPVLGTSIASPLSAGIFALVASRLGCRLGDIHRQLYELGAAQADGGTVVFHDLTQGNITFNGITGPSADAGFDEATGWGSIDVTALANAFPPCPAIPDGGIPDAGLIAYDPCTFSGCQPGCTTLTEGPSTCETPCTLGADAGCAVGTVCNGGSIFAMGNSGLCVPGCATQTDCASQTGTVCSLCAQVCVPMGNDTNMVGGNCAADTDCPSGAVCFTGRGFNGYCTYPCTPGVQSTDACACPAQSECGTVGRVQKTNLCLATCDYAGEACASRTDMICQPQDTGSPACLPLCTIRTTMSGMMFDSCTSDGSSLHCDLDSGVCGGPVAPPMMDAGVDAGTDGGSDAGTDLDAGDDAGTMSDGGTPLANGNLGKPASGCGCNAAGPLPFALGLVLLALRRKRA